MTRDTLPSEAEIEAAVDLLSDLKRLDGGVWSDAHFENLKYCLTIVMPILRARVGDRSNGDGGSRPSTEGVDPLAVESKIERLSAELHQLRSTLDELAEDVETNNRDLDDVIERVGAIEVLANG